MKNKSPFIKNHNKVYCLGCAIQREEVKCIGGIIAATEYFEARQDTNFDYIIPIPGFVIIACKRHVRSIDEFTAEERKDFIEFLCKMRKCMREQLKIDTVYLIQEEEVAHFHMWLFPRYDWMTPFGKKIKSVKPIMQWAKEHLNTEENLKRVLEYAEKLKNGMCYREKEYNES